MYIETLTLSPDGTLQLPETIRNALELKDVTRMIAIGPFADGYSIMLKPVWKPSAQTFLTWMDDAQAWADKAGYREEDVDRMIQEVRGRT